ncbi:hypothetical protein [Beijerinckia indica]|uniref:Uncharacterized protein n=1 Tax=Beijerinckia indica subsp. indica (strain ATCC 9039 / DSM 1715 / NCIMB 8712) TaxID=395963 RepID=B2IDX1_BEII9|nr:hypothetical protein [Beijerinckia indica]ACB96903.1 hypothetical protein Bind_3345 [Beijerinckia indica subsp. indica ATCC 9039]
MNTFDRIVFLFASGPGIASPTIDRFELTRAELKDTDADHIDLLIAEAHFFELHDDMPGIKIFDGPHKSHITIEMADGRSHSLAFVLSNCPAPLLSLLHFIQEHAKPSSI